MSLVNSLPLVGIRVASFLRWWWAVLLDVLPGILIALLAGDRRRVRVSSSVEKATLIDQRHKVRLEAEWTEAEGRWMPDETWRRILAVTKSRPVELRLSETELLSQEVRLPRAALENLSGAVLHGLSTWSPFSPNEVHVAAVPVGSDDMSCVELRYAMREFVDPVLSRAADRGLIIDRIVLGCDRWQVAVEERKAARIRRQHWIDCALVLFAALLVTLALQTAWTRQDLARERVGQALRGELELARQQGEFDRAIEYAAKARKAVDAERQVKPLVSELLAHLKSILPSDAAIVALELDQKQGLVTIEQRSANDLTSTLIRSQLLRDVQFRPGGMGTLMVHGPSSSTIQAFSFTLAAREVR
jgi:hypothetical protein